MTIGEFCKLIDDNVSEYSIETLVFYDENAKVNARVCIGSPLIKNILDKKFKYISAIEANTFGIWGLED